MDFEIKSYIYFEHQLTLSMPVETPITSETDQVSFAILVNGKEIDSSYQCLSIEIYRNLKKAALASLSFLDGMPDTGEFPLSDSDVFVPGNTITIKAGYHGNDTVVFEGSVTKQEIRFDAETSSQLIVHCGGSIDEQVGGSMSPVIEVKFGDSILSFEAEKTSTGVPEGKVSFQGSALVAPGKVISLKGVGKRFNGDMLMTGIMHDINSGNWTTNVRFGKADSYVMEELEESAGLYTGIVKQIDQDPDKSFRVMVDIPILNMTGIWARMGNAYAGNNSGIFFYPEIGNEVAVGFVNHDPRNPVILGSMFNATDKVPPFTPDPQNSMKGIVTYHQVKLVLDDLRKSVTISTPSGNSVVLSDDSKSMVLSDCNGNKITMSSAGISIESCGSLDLRAATSIALNAQSGLDAKASGGEMNLSAMTINALAYSQIKLTGEAAAELSAGGEVSINGSMVMIN
jgi:hypothetical protein